MKRKRNSIITKKMFEKIKIGDELVLRFMIGKNRVTKLHQELEDYDYITIDFTEGPWASKNEIKIIRQQIKSIK